MVRTRIRSLAAGMLLFLASAAPARRTAEALEVSGGASAGGMLAGTKPRPAVSLHGALAWRADSGFLLAFRDMFSVLVAIDEHGAGVHNQTSIMLGFATETLSLSAGPAFSLYSMPACNAASRCSRVVGLAPGGYLHAALFAGPVGLSVSGSLEWVGGRSDVLPGGVAAMVVAGPVLRWTTR
jgi:hypothetical protein